MNENPLSIFRVESKIRRQNIGLILSLGIIAMLLSIGFFYLGSRSNHTLIWGIEIGDEYLYDVSVFGYDNNSQVPFIGLNNTRIIVRVTDLPEIPQQLNFQSFLANVLEITKTDCWFENGTYFTQTWRDGINELMSRCILPVGDFELIDSLTNGTLDNGYGSSFSEGSFYIGYHYFIVDFGHGWEGNVTLDTGVPVVTSLWDFSWHPPGEWFNYGITLTKTIS